MCTRIRYHAHRPQNALEDRITPRKEKTIAMKLDQLVQEMTAEEKAEKENVLRVSTD